MMIFSKNSRHACLIIDLVVICPKICSSQKFEALKGRNYSVQVGSWKVQIYLCSCFSHSWSIGFKPMIISRVGRINFEWKQKKIATDSGEYNLERRHFPSYVLYSNSKAWMTADLFIWEMERISSFLKKNHAGKNFCILMDNCSSHKRIEFEQISRNSRFLGDRMFGKSS